VLLGEAARLWERFSGQELRWRILAVRPVPADAVDLIEERLEGGGIVARQSVRLEEGTLSWLVALTPHTWHALLRLTAQGMQRPVNDVPNRYTIFGATGWQRGTPPWNTLVSFCSDRDLHQLVRGLTQSRLGEPHLAAVAAALRREQRERWMEAMPVMLRERTDACHPAPAEVPALEHALAQALIALYRAGRLPDSKLGAWVGLCAEMLWARRQGLIDRLLPLRHLVYGLDRSSLSRLLFDVRNDVLTDLLCWAEFPVIDQVRRAISPGFALRLLEDIAVRRRRATAFACQEAQLTLYRTALHGLAEGRYLIRPTPARNLRDLLRWLDEP